MSKKKRVLLGCVIIFILINIIIGITVLIINFKNTNKVIDGDKGAVFDDTSCYFEKTEKENTDSLLGTNIRFATNELLVSANNDVTYEQIEGLANSYNAKIVGYIEITGDYQWKLSTRQTEEQLNSLINELEKEDIILSADFNILLKNNLNYEPVDNDWNSIWDESYPNGDNWGLEAINALSAWNNRKQMSEIKIGLFDTAFDTSGSINNYNDDSGNNQHNYTIDKDSSATGNEVTVNNILRYTDEDLNYEGHEDLDFAMTFYNPSHSKSIEILNTLNSNSHSLLTHGSHVAGTMGATFDNGKGISGVYPNARGNIYGVSVLGLSSFAENISIMSYKCAFAELICRDVKIINVSLAYDGSSIYNTYKNIGTYRKNHELISKELGNFLERLIDKGYDFVIVSSAGNTSNLYFKFNSYDKVYEKCSKKDKNSETAVIPCEYNGPLNGIKNEKVKDRIIVVGACNYKYLGFGKFEYYRCEFSNEGERLDVIAPGANIRSTVNGGYESGWQGTSMAAPHVSGIAAMVWSINSNLTGADVKKIVKDSANIDVTNSGRDMINAYRAVNNIDVYKNMAISNDLKNELKNGIAIASVVESADESKKIQGATIKVSDLNGNILDYDKTETDFNGRFELILPEGQYNIVVNADGYKEYIIKNVNILAGQVSYLEWAKLESELNYTWHLEPTIEAEDIIVSDDSIYTTFCNTKASDTYSIIKKNGKYTMIDYDGKLVTEDLYDRYYFGDAGEICLWRYDVSPYSLMANYSYLYDGDYETIIKDGDYGIIVTKDDYGMARGMTGGWAGFCYDSSNKTIYADRCFEYEVFDGHIGDEELKIPRAVLVQSSNVTQNYNNNYYDVELLGKYGIAYDDKIVVDTIYDDGRMSLYNDMIILKYEDKWGYFNGQTGEQIIDFKCNDVQSNKFATSWDYDEKNGVMVEKTHKTYPYVFSGGYVALYTDDGCGYYDTQGNEVIPCGTFEEVRPVHNSLAWVKKDGKWGVIKLKKIEKETNTGNNNSYVNIKDYEGTYYPTNSEYNVYLKISNIVENSADVYIGITNNRGTRVSENTYTGNITNKTITFETQDGFGKNQFTLEFTDNKIYLTGRCIELNDFEIWAIPELNRLEMQLSNKQEPLFTGTVNTEKDPLNVRKSPSDNAEIIGRIDKASTVTVYSESGDWYEIEYNGGVGYVSKKYIKNQGDNSDTQTSSISNNEILKAVNKYLEENRRNLGIWLSDGNPYCPYEHVASNSTNWSCPINTDWDSYSSNEIAGAYPHFAYVDKSTLKCTITANYETIVEFDLSNYLN